MNTALSERELSHALDTVYRINTTEDVLSYARLALSLLCASIPCEQAIFTVIDDIDGIPHSGNTYVWGREARLMDEFKAGGYEHDKFLLSMNLKANSYAARDSDLMSEEELLSMRLYRDIYKPEGVRYVMRISLIWHDKMIGQFTFFRGSDSCDFSDHELEIGSLFAPHLALKYNQLKSSSLDSSHSGRIKSRYGLTTRELEVVTLVVEGLSDDVIAEKLFISNSTVKKHLYNAYSKMGVSNKLQLKMCLGED